jgi:TPR repeat protein
VGVPSNRVEAFKWLKLAAMQGQTDASSLLQKLKSQMSSEESAHANQIVKKFIPRAANSTARKSN